MSQFVMNKSAAEAAVAEILARNPTPTPPPPLPAVLEGGLHVRAMADMLLELVPHLPMRPRGPMGTFFYLSGLNTPDVVERIQKQEIEVIDAAPAFVPTHAQTSWCISDAELSDVAHQGAVALDVLKLLVRERAAAAIAGLKEYSPGITDLHWVGPSRQQI